MKSSLLNKRKLYAMRRMGVAIDRAVAERSSVAKEQAAKWAAAWGLLCGIKSRAVKLKRSRDVMLPEDMRNLSLKANDLVESA